MFFSALFSVMESDSGLKLSTHIKPSTINFLMRAFEVILI